VSALHSDVRADVRFEPAPNGGGGYLALRSRRIGNDFYAATLRVGEGATPQLSLRRRLGGPEEVLAVRTITGLPTGPTDELSMRFEVVPAEDGTAGATLRGKVWPAGEPEPEQWQVTAGDAAPALQGAGTFGLNYYISGSATNGPGALHVSRFTVSSTDAAG
jgi:hypothetical protein